MTLRFHTPLTPDEQLAHGLDTAQPLAIADKVRFAELDAQDHVNNKAYLTWFESLRIAYYDHLCASHYAGMPRPRILLHSLTLRFVKEMLRDETYITTARVSAFRTSSYTMDQQLWAGNLRARMSVVVVLGQPDGPARVPLPDGLRQQFVTLDEASDER